MGFSGELMVELAAVLMEAGPRTHAGSEISSDWIAGIRKSWKKLVDKAKKPPGTIEKASAIDFELIPQAAKVRLAALDELTSYVRALRADLTINKGMWTMSSPDAAKKMGSKAEVLRAKVVGGLDNADMQIDDARGRIKYITSAVDTTSHDHKMSGGSFRRDAEASLDGFNRILNTINGAGMEAAVNADDEVSRGVLKALSAGILKIKDQVGKTTEHPVDFGSRLPDTVQVGRVTLVFADGPADGDSPARPRARHRTAVGSVSSVIADPRDPRERKYYLRELQKAEDLLRKRGLGHLWYGRIVIMCSECGGANPHGTSYSTAAHYHRKGDWLSVYIDHGVAKLIAHELGHRYYYKFMSANDRALFDRWYGTIKPVSSYGGTATEEDFAEVFAWYIDGRHLDGDQLARLRTFLGKKRKLEQVEEKNLAALTS